MKPDPFEAVVLLPHLCIQNANAISGPLTWGFPPPSAFAGFVHALQRRLDADGARLQLGGVGIVCHVFEPQVFTPPGRRTQVFRLTRNPVGQDGGTAAIVEEGRVHLDISLVITVSGGGCPVNEDQCQALAAQFMAHAEGMRIAGGSVIPYSARQHHAPHWFTWDHEDSEQSQKLLRSLRRRLLPGFALVSREALLAQHLAHLQQTTPHANALDALLDLCRLNVEPAQADVEQTAITEKRWTIRRDYPGWLVPIPVGYAAISPLYAPGEVRHARDDGTPFRFVESVLSLGEWISPHRIQNLEQLLWYHDARPDEGLYRLHNPYAPLDRTYPTA